MSNVVLNCLVDECHEAHVLIAESTKEVGVVVGESEGWGGLS